MNKITTGGMILIFALLHALVALGCRAFGITDDVMLTLLTMLMTVLICIRRRMGVPFMAISVTMVNVFGILLGKATALLIGLLFSSSLVIYPLSTLLCTIIMGWTVYGLSLSGWARNRKVDSDKVQSGSLLWLLVAFVIIIVVRMVMVLPVQGYDAPNSKLGIVLDYVFTLAVVVFLAEYALRLQARAKAAAEQANLAQYRYMMLKQQVNPHFLFNSLNILDYLIEEESREQASEYTRKLSDIYRYLISSEDIQLVKLRDELDFVRKYIDLLQVRWPEGLDVSIDIPEDMMSMQLAPCCVQLLIENATKHNAVIASNPLRISVKGQGDSIMVSNSRIPKITSTDSTGLGLKYIRRHCQDMAHRELVITETDDQYSVTLPLI